MTQTDRMELLRQKCIELGQAEVGRRIGYTGSTVSQILSGKYGGNPDKVLQRVDEVFGGTMLLCPAFNEEITLGKCAEYRKRPLNPGNPFSQHLWRACGQCERNGGKP